MSVSLRVRHRRTRDLIVRLKRPNYLFPGGKNQTLPRVVVLSQRDTRGKNLGRGQCPDSDPGFAPAGFTTFNDAGGPPYPMLPEASPPLSERQRPLRRNLRAPQSRSAVSTTTTQHLRPIRPHPRLKPGL